MLYHVISQKTLPILYHDNLISDHVLHKSNVTTMVILNCQVTENGRVRFLLFHARSNTYCLCCSRSATIVYLCCWLFMLMILPASSTNLLTPNVDYSGRAAPVTSKCCILYIYSTNTGTENFKHGIYPPFFLFKMQFVS